MPVSEPTPTTTQPPFIPPGTISPYLTLAEAAAYARTSKRTIQRWISEHKLTRYGHGSHLIHRQELEQFLAPAGHPKATITTPDNPAA